MKKSSILLLLFFSIFASAQDDSTQKDLSDFLFSGLRKDRKAKNESTLKKTKRVFFTFLPGLGYGLQKGFSLVSNTNASYYNHKDSASKISTIDLNMEYTQFRQVLFRGNNNIWTKHNRFFIKGDWRYLYNSTLVYGLGGKNEDLEAELINYSHVRFYELILYEIFPDFLAGLGYNLDYRWKIRSDPSNSNFTNDEVRIYGLNPKSTSSGISFNLLFDPRKNLNNPTKGIYANLIYKNNHKLIGSNTNWSSVLLDLRKYIIFPRNSKNVLAFWNYNWFTLSGQPPYFDLPGNGWDTKSNTARAYRQGRYMSKNMVYAETEYRFGITRNGLVAGVVYANALSLTNIENTKFEKIVPGIGGGVRILTNKRSDTHFILTYSIGVNKAHGFSINIGEAF